LVKSQIASSLSSVALTRFFLVSVSSNLTNQKTELYLSIDTFTVKNNCADC